MRNSCWPWVVVGALLLLAVLPFGGLTLFAHPYFDDYNIANNIADLGWFGSQWQWYQTWSGRVVTIALNTLLNPLAWGQLGAPAGHVLAALRALLLLGQLAYFLALQQFFRALLPLLRGPAAASPTPPGLDWALALLLTALGMNALPEPFSFLYWFSAMFVYQLAGAFSLGFVAAALRTGQLPAGRQRRRWATVAAVCLAAAIGSNELGLLVCLVSLAGLGWWLRRHRPAAWRPWLVWAGLALVLAGLTLAAPGNWNRAAVTDAYPQAHRWLLLLPRTGLAVLRLVGRPVVAVSALGLIVALLGLGRLLRPVPAPPRRPDVLAALAGYAVLNTLVVAFMKVVWVDPLLGRVSNLLVLVLLVSTASLALWVGTWWRPARLRWRGGATAVLLAAGLAGLFAMGQVGRAWPELLVVAPTYDQQMQARYALLRRAHAQGQPTASVPPLRLPLVPGVLVPLAVPGRQLDFSVEIKPTYPENPEIARYFGLQGVRRQPPAAAAAGH